MWKYTADNLNLYRIINPAQWIPFHKLLAILDLHSKSFKRIDQLTKIE